MDANKHLRTQRQIVLNSASSSTRHSSGGRRSNETATARAFKKYNEQLQQQQAAKTRQETRTLFEMGPEKAAEVLDQHCPYCHELLIPRFIEPGQYNSPRLFMIWPDCGCKQGKAIAAQFAEDKRRSHLTAQMKLYEARLDKAGLVGWMRGATFASYEPREDFPGGETCKQKVMDYCHKFLNGELDRIGYRVPNGEMDLEQAIKDYNLHKAREMNKNWLVLYGNFGNGKSHLSAAIIKAVVEAGRQNIFFRIWPDYLDRLKETYNKKYDGDETETKILAELRDGDLVIIDDLDKDQPTEWVRKILYKALNHRYNEALPTVLTFNFAPTDSSPRNAGRLALEDYLGRAALDRILEVSTVVEFNGPSYRSGIEWSAQTQNIEDEK